MLRRSGPICLALALAACTEQVVLRDLPSASDAAVGPKDAWPVSDANCGQVKYSQLIYVPQPADILILLDRSSAMQKDFGGVPRESAAQAALTAQVGQYQARIKFGFEEFPSDPLEYPCPQGTCCAAPVSYSGPSINNYTAMSNGIWCSDAHGPSCPVTGSDSPSYAALAQVRDYYKAKDNRGPNPSFNARYILLVTASEPSCAAESHDPCSMARGTASDLGDANISIFVLSMGYQPDHNSCLSQISQNGSPVPPAANTKRLYQVSNTSDLSQALGELFSAVARASCTMITRNAPAAPNQDNFKVSIGNNHFVQPLDGNGNGWSLGDPAGTSITFSGSACYDWVNSYSQDTTPYVVYSDGPSNCSWQYP